MEKFFILFIVLLISLTNQKDFLEKDKNEKPRKLSTVEVNLELLRQQLLTSHNKYRKNHQADKMTRNTEIEDIAQEYAEHLASIQGFVHSDNKYKGQGLGENIYWAYNIELTGEVVTKDWYSEIKNYDFSTPGFKQGTGHFTQVVWKSSKEIGCGFGESDGYYVVCNYYPAGNFHGQFDKNVFPYKEAASQDTDDDDSSSSSSTSKKEGGSIAGRIFLTIFILLLLAIGGFCIFHFVLKKRNVSQLKDYLCC